MTASRSFLVVACVLATAGAATSGPRFTRTEPTPGQPIVADASTGLVWQGCAAGQTGTACSGTASTFTWQAALDYCQDLFWGGNTDWYLPNIDELTSIVDYRRANPAIDVLAFPSVPLDTNFWSSSSETSGHITAYVVTINGGHVGSPLKTSTWHVRCVRAGP